MYKIEDFSVGQHMECVHSDNIDYVKPGIDYIIEEIFPEEGILGIREQPDGPLVAIRFADILIEEDYAACIME